MDHSPDPSKQNRGHQKGSTQRQVVKKEIKLEAVEDTINHRLMCNHPDHHSGKEMLKLQQKVDQLVGEAIAREKEIEKFTNELISQSQVTVDEKQKQIAELEGSLNDKTKKVVELEKALSKAGRTLQGFVSELQKKEKELEQLKIEAHDPFVKVGNKNVHFKEARDAKFEDSIDFSLLEGDFTEEMLCWKRYVREVCESGM